MVIDATKQFACQHEYVGIAGGPYLSCHKCGTARPDLTLAQIDQSIDRKPRLVFFPMERKVG